MDTKRACMEENLIAQGTGGGDAVIVYPDRVEFRSGERSQNAFSVGLKQLGSVHLRGLINCTLTIESNDGRHLNIERMALPDARQVKAAIECQKRTSGFLSSPDSSSKT